MKFYKIAQSLLFALLIIGVFASMARNSYGFAFMGTACFGLAFLYLVQWAWRLIDDYSIISWKNVWEIMELFLLAALLTMFGCRALYIYVNSGEQIFITVCASLLLVYVSIGVSLYQDTKKVNPGLARNMAFIYVAIQFFLLALGFRSMSAVLSLIFGTLGALTSLPFLWAVIRQRQFDYAGKSISLFQFIASSKNKTGLLFIFFLSSALYTGMTYLSVVPEIENGDRPKDYIELIKEAENGAEKPVDGKYHHEVYKEAMDRFLKRHAEK